MHITTFLFAICFAVIWWSRSEPPALVLLEDKCDRVVRHTCVGVVSGWLEGYAFWMESTWERLAKPDRT
jgi:hypothetical protein